MLDQVTIAFTETSRALRMDENTIGDQIALVTITGGTGDVIIESTLSQPEAGNDFTNAVWFPLLTVTSGTDAFVRSGPWTAFRANGSALSAGTALIQVQQAVRV